MSRVLVFAIALLSGRVVLRADPPPSDLAPTLATVRAANPVPALAGAVVRGGATVALGVDGGPALDAPWNLGWASQALSATVIALLAASGDLRLETTIAEATKGSPTRLEPYWKAVTIEQLLAFRGLGPSGDADTQTLAPFSGLPGKPRAHRAALADAMLAAHPPGTVGKEIPSAAGVLLAVALVERLTGRAFEDLVQERLFDRLGMAATRFGEPAFSAPAIGIRTTLADYAKFLAFHLAVEAGTVPEAASLRRLHAPARGFEWAPGWRKSQPAWAEGPLLTSSTRADGWTVGAYLAPAKDLALVVFCNESSDAAAKAVLQASRALLVTVLGDVFKIEGVEDAAAGGPPIDLGKSLRSVLDKRGVPALAGALVLGGRIVAIGAEGSRKRGVVGTVGLDDRWWLGASSAPLTAALVAVLAQKERLSFETDLAHAFPKLRAKIGPAWRAVTLSDLLLSSEPDGSPERAVWEAVAVASTKTGGKPVDQRAALLEDVAERRKALAVLGVPPWVALAIAGGAAESLARKPFEELIAETLFRPLGMEHSGFHAPRTAADQAQPIGHSTNPTTGAAGADPTPRWVALLPGSGLHASIGDWARFHGMLLMALDDRSDLLDSDAIGRLFQPLPGKRWAGGWFLDERPWAKGKVAIAQSGFSGWQSNAWLAPGRRAALLALCNQDGAAGLDATNDVITLLVGMMEQVERAGGK